MGRAMSTRRAGPTTREIKTLGVRIDVVDTLWLLG
jgi:hypothetical protein